MKNISILFYFLLISSCNNTENQHKGQKINIPNKMLAYTVDDIQIHEVNNISNDQQPTIYTLINVSCSTCLLKLEQWNTFYSEIESNKISFVPICHSKDDFELLKYLAENNQIGNLKFPLYLDIENQFIHLNESLISDIGDFTALTNSKNQIILSGNPTEDQNIKKEYLNLINSF